MTGRPNPYVGPRAVATGEPLYGRERERAALLDLVIAERIVLLHAPSGAGKSSLLQAGLVPDLVAEGFTVRPVIRVGMELPAGAPAGVNRFVASVVASLDESARPMDLTAALEQDGLASEVLIFDQFEEVLTLEPNDRAAKHAFFTALATALRSPRRWAVFAIREDYVGSLGPYARVLPTRLRSTFQLELLGPVGALEAAQRPAQAVGVAFTDAAARRLIDDLREVQIQAADGSTTRAPGPFVEPVQLQVACRNLWARLPDDDDSIDVADIAAIGDVDAALTDYYETQVAAVVADGVAGERDIRAWFDRALITEHGLRGQVLQTAEVSAGLANAVIGRLIDVHLVRGEKRRGLTWFELAHDRMLAPVRSSNARWTEAHLSPAQRQAELWDSSGRPEALLLREGAAIDRLVAAAGISAVERAFAASSRVVVAREAETERLRKQSLLLRRVVMGGVVSGLVIVVLMMLMRYRDEQARAASEARLRAEAERATEDARSEGERAELAAEQALARALAAEVSLLPEDRIDLAALLAVAASTVTDGVAARTGLYALSARAPRLVGTLRGTMVPRRLARSGDGVHLAGYDEHGRLYVWHLPTRRLLWSRDADTLAFTDLTFDARRGMFVTADLGGRVVWWDPERGEATDAIADAPSLRALALATAPDGPRLATADAGGEVTVIDTDSGARVSTRIAGVEIGDGVEVLRFSADGGSLAIVTRRGVALWPWRAGLEVGETENIGGVIAVRFVDGGAAIVGVDGAGDVIRWPIVGGRPGAAAQLGQLVNDPEVDRPREPLLAIGLAEDGAQAVAVRCLDVCTRVVLRVWDAASGRVADTRVELRDRDPAGRRFPIVVDAGTVTVGGTTVATRVFDTRTWRPWSGPMRGVEAASFGQDGRQVALAGCAAADCSDGGEIVVWPLATAVQAFAPIRAHARGVDDVAYFAGGSRLASVGRGDRGLKLWDAATGEPIAGVATVVPPGMTLHAGGPMLFAVAADGLRVIDASTGVLRHAGLMRGIATVVAIDEAGTRIAAGWCAHAGEPCTRGMVQVWDLGDGSSVMDAREGHAGGVTALRFGHDADVLASAGDDGSLRRWDLVGGAAVDLFGEDDGATRAIVWSADDASVVTVGCVAGRCDVSAESRLRLLLGTTLQPLAPSRRMHAPTYAPVLKAARAVAVAADGEAYYTVSRDGVVVWDAKLDAMRATACRLAGREPTEDEWARHIVPARPQVPLCR